MKKNEKKNMKYTTWWFLTQKGKACQWECAKSEADFVKNAKSAIALERRTTYWKNGIYQGLKVKKIK